MEKQTLQERYTVKRSQIKESLLKAERKLKERDALIESLILEEFDENMMQQANQIVKGLLSLDFGNAGLNSFASARDAAVKDVDKVRAGKSNRGVIRRIISMFKDQKENPLVDVLAFCNALYEFFRQYRSYIESHKGTAENPDELSVQELLTGLSAEDVTATQAAAAAGANTETQQNLKTLQQIIIKGLKPKGILAQVGKTWTSKYFKNNFKQLAQEIMNANVGELDKIATDVEGALKNSQAVGQAAAGAQEVAGKETSQTTGTEKTKSTEVTGASAPAERSKETAETGAAPSATGSRPSKQRVEQAYNKIKGILDDNNFDIPEPQVKAIIQLLGAHGYLK